MASGQAELKGWLASMEMIVKMAMWQPIPRRHKGGHLASVRSSAEEKLLQKLVLARYSFFCVVGCIWMLITVANQLKRIISIAMYHHYHIKAMPQPISRSTTWSSSYSWSSSSSSWSPALVGLVEKASGWGVQTTHLRANGLGWTERYQTNNLSVR